MLTDRAKDILASWVGAEAHVTADSSKYTTYCALATAGYLMYVRRYVRRGIAWHAFRPTALGEQTIVSIVDSRVDEINRSEPV